MKKWDKFTSSSRPKRKPKVGDMAAMAAMPATYKSQGHFCPREDASGQPSEHFRIVDTLAPCFAGAPSPRPCTMQVSVLLKISVRRA